MTATSRDDWLAPYRSNGALQGSCLCRAVTLRVDGPYLGAVGICHCGRCRRWNGMVWGAFEASPEAVTVTGPVSRHASTSFSERAFCPRCGSHLWLRDTDDPAAPYELMPGIFDDTAAFPLISEIYIDCVPAHAAMSVAHRRKTQAEYEAKNRHVEGDLP